MDKLVYQYIKRYEPNVEADDLSNLKKQLVILLNKLHDNKSVYKNLPFDYMPVDQQLKLMHHLRTSPVAGRQIISNMTKIDADRSFLEFACPSLNNVFSGDSELREIRENLLSLDQWVLDTRFQIRLTEDSRSLLLNLMRIDSSILRCYQEEDDKLLIMGVGLAGFERLRSYIDYVANALLQFLVYHIVVNKKEKALATYQALAVPQKISNGSSLIKTGIAEYSPFYYKPKSEITWRGGTEYTYNITIEGSTLSVTTRTSICRSTAGAASGSGCVTFIAQ